MKRRLFVGQTTVISTGLSLGVSQAITSLSKSRFESIATQEMSKFQKQLSDLLTDHPSSNQIITSLTTPVQTMSKKVSKTSFYWKFKNDSGDYVTLSRDSIKDMSKVCIEKSA